MNNISSNISNFLAKSNYSYDYDAGGGGFLAFFFWFLIIIGLYVYTSLVLMKIAKKTNTSNSWMAWIPILKHYLLCKISGKSIIWFIMFFFPFINLVAMVVLWAAVAEKRGRPAWWGVLMLVPIVNLVVRGVLAFSDVPGARQEKSAPAVPEKKKPQVFSMASSKTGMACSRCGASVSESDKFCPDCGAKVVKKQGNFCPNCRAKIKSSDKFCPDCGAKL
ncbi:hypothetical protein AMJ47_04135 [Parcubacteria bacterium DG_72]|nr:MAG: hypothetical protein AMJ47_04135 [Parcubacteria bacterium DG_72]